LLRRSHGRERTMSQTTAEKITPEVRTFFNSLDSFVPTIPDEVTKQDENHISGHPEICCQRSLRRSAGAETA